LPSIRPSTLQLPRYLPGNPSSFYSTSSTHRTRSYAQSRCRSISCNISICA
jgi:hypothetical protein